MGSIKDNIRGRVFGVENFLPFSSINLSFIFYSSSNGQISYL